MLLRIKSNLMNIIQICRVNGLSNMASCVSQLRYSPPTENNPLGSGVNNRRSGIGHVGWIQMQILRWVGMGWLSTHLQARWHVVIRRLVSEYHNAGNINTFTPRQNDHQFGNILKSIFFEKMLFLDSNFCDFFPVVRLTIISFGTQKWKTANNRIGFGTEEASNHCKIYIIDGHSTILLLALWYIFHFHFSLNIHDYIRCTQNLI